MAGSWDAAMTATALVCSCFLPECLLPAARITTSDSATCRLVRRHLLPIREHFDARVGRGGKRTGRGRVPSGVPVPPVLDSHFLFFYLVNFLVLFVRS
uniref:Secreted protein n=1 Tax=Ixodes ricinus TaxID=34613 RepID=A0A6B0U7F1_IXORI